MTTVPRTLLSSFCRYQEHSRCTQAKAKCQCKCHASGRPRAVEAVPDETPRPNPIQRSPMATPEPAETPRPTSEGKVEPVVELVKEEPPARSGRVTAAERYAKELEAVKAAAGEWYRLLNFHGDFKAAAQCRSALQRQTDGFELVSRRGFIWARFTGEAS